MKLLSLLLLPLLTSCAIEKFNMPPTWSSVVITHTRFYGIDATIPIGNGLSIGVKLGGGSQTCSIIPCATNRVFIPAIADTLSLAQSINPFDTTIREDVTTGYEGPPPAARYGQLFSPLPPKLRPLTNSP